MKRLFLAAGCFATTIATAAMVTIFDDNNEEFTFTLRDQLTIEPDGDVQLFIVENLTQSQGGNNPPVANNDSDSTVENTAVNIDVTDNDTDQDGDLNHNSVTIVSGPNNGSAVPQSLGVVRYTPTTNFTGGDSFVYRVSDAMGNSDTATVSVTVTPDGGGGGPNCAADFPPVQGYSKLSSPNTFDHCNIAQQVFLNLGSTQYLAMRMNMNSCSGDNNGSITWETQAGSGSPLRVTVSQCPGVFDDAIPPIPDDSDAHLCSSPSIVASQVRWSIAGESFRCNIEPGQQVYLNVLYGDNGDPPIPSCAQSSCGFILSALN